MDDVWKALTDASDPVYRYLIRLTGDKARADELMQDTLLACYRGFHRFRGECKLSTWMIAVARRIQSRERARRKDAPLEDAEAISVEADDQRVADKLLIEQAMREIRKMPPGMRDAILMRVSEQKSYREIGAALGESEGWARVTCLRARRRLMGVLGGDADE